MNNVHFSSKKMDWATPQKLFTLWDSIYGPFVLDVCATKENTKCKMYFTPETDGLNHVWWGNCWMNPPYGREISKWMKKAFEEVKEKNANKVVCLVPARTDTYWWHDYVMPFKVIFLQGRIKFEGAKYCAPFPSVLVIME